MDLIDCNMLKRNIVLKLFFQQMCSSSTKKLF